MTDKILASTVIRFREQEPVAQQVDIINFDEENEGLSDNERDETTKDPTIGEPLKVKLYAKDSYTMKSPYGGALAKKISTKPVGREEIVQVNGEQKLKTLYPIKTLHSANVVMGLINDNTRVIDAKKNQTIRSDLQVIENKLVLKDDGVDYFGAIKIRYDTFPAQEWTHKPFTTEGTAKLFFENKKTGNIISAAKEIKPAKNRARDDGSIKIEAHDEQSDDVYHKFRVYFNGNHRVQVEASAGKVMQQMDGEAEIWGEAISISGDTASPSFYARKTVLAGGIKGSVINEQGIPVSLPAHVGVSKGKFTFNKKYFGTVIIPYIARYALFHYQKEKKYYGNTFLGSTVGSVIAMSRGAVAKYDIPKKDPTSAVVVYRLYSAVLTVAKSREAYELPPDLDSENEENKYPSHPEITEEELADVADGFAIWERTHATISVQGDDVFVNLNTKEPLKKPFVEGYSHVAFSYVARPATDDEGLSDAEKRAKDEKNKKRPFLDIEFLVMDSIQFIETADYPNAKLRAEEEREKLRKAFEL